MTCFFQGKHETYRRKTKYFSICLHRNFYLFLCLLSHILKLVFNVPNFGTPSKVVYVTLKHRTRTMAEISAHSATWTL